MTKMSNFVLKLTKYAHRNIVKAVAMTIFL